MPSRSSKSTRFGNGNRSPKSPSRRKSRLPRFTPWCPPVSWGCILWRCEIFALTSAMLTIRVMRNGAGYAKRHLEQNDYYAEGEKVTGQWFGKGAEKLGLSGEVLSEQFERVRQGLDPQTGEKLRQRNSDRIAQDGSREKHGRS